jgi:glucose-6-phosphate dehydrogenase assembly protein OpcA
MPDTSSDAFLSGQGIAVAPAGIEDELVRLWGPAAERVGGPELENPNVTRIVLANLIVQADCENARCIVGILDEVVARFPSRSIVLGLTGDTGREIAAEVAALCHLPAPGMPQVCSERILLKAGPAAFDLLPGAVRPLLETDLPVILWWTGDPRSTESLYRELAREATRIILDLPDPGADPEALRLGLDPAIHAYSRDSAWFGIARWRELIAQFFDGSQGPEAIRRIESVTIDAIVPTAAPPPRLAVWIAAWLAGQFGWTPVRRSEPTTGRIEAVFRAGDRDVAVTIVAQTDPSVKEVSVHAVTIETSDNDGPASLRLARPVGRPEELRVEICSDRTCALPRGVVAPELDAPRRVATALESARLDIPYRRALPLTLWLLTR